MTKQGAQHAVTGSAVVTAAVFAYRKLTESSTGSKTTASTAHFALGFAIVYFTLGILAEAAPEVGGMMAILVAAGDLLANGAGLVNDLNAGLKAASTTTGTGSTTTMTSTSSSVTPGVTPTSTAAAKNPSITGEG